MAEDDDWEIFAGEPSGYLESPPPGQVVGDANDEAAGILTTWLIALGLSGEIDDLRLQEEERIVPAPGFYTLKDEIEQAARVACESADMIAMLLSGEGMSEHERSERVGAAIARLNDLRRTRKAVESGLLRLAQLGLGVSTLTIAGDRIERLERAGVAVLHPPAARPHALYEQTPRLFSSTRDELVVEVGGILCRLLIDRASTATFSTTAGQIEFSVEHDTLIGTVESRSEAAPTGWSETTLPPTVRWDSPVNVGDPARLAVDTLIHVLGLAPISSLEVAYGDKRSQALNR